MGVEAHFIDYDGDLQNFLIAFRVIYGPHTGSAICTIVTEIAEHYEICADIGYTTMDNALNNNTFAEEFYQYLGKPNWRHFRIRCGTHILNLRAKAGIYGNKRKKGVLPSREAEAQIQEGG